VKWSVSIVAEGDRVVSHDEVVELADAVAAWDGIASGIGARQYGAQLVVEAEDRETAVRDATEVFVRAVERAGLPRWPVTDVAAVSEAEDQLGELA
jgi:1,2-phenylacetyl-CoA epoxidase PaaB subunit